MRSLLFIYLLLILTSPVHGQVDPPDTAPIPACSNTEVRSALTLIKEDGLLNEVDTISKGFADAYGKAGLVRLIEDNHNLTRHWHEEIATALPGCTFAVRLQEIITQMLDQITITLSLKAIAESYRDERLTMNAEAIDDLAAWHLKRSSTLAQTLVALINAA